MAKIHHAVADGSAVVALLQNVVQGADVEPSKEPGADSWRPEPLPTRHDLLKMAAP